MSTVEDVSRGVIAAVGSDVSWQLVEQWVNSRYHQICRRVRMRHLRHSGEILIPANITAGLAIVTNGSTTVTGDVTATAAWSSAVIGRHLKISSGADWYEIADYNAGTITLKTAYIGTSAPSGTGYTLAQRFTPLVTGIRHMASFVNMSRRMPIKLLSFEELDLYAPSRNLTGQSPRVTAEVGQALDSNGARVRTMEFYPYDNVASIVHYLYWTDPPDLIFSDELPIGLDEDILREGTLIDLMRYEMTRLVKAGNIEAAALMRNEYRAQETVWERYIQQAIREDRGTDDSLFFLEEANSGLRTGSITNAHDQVLANWPH